MRMLSNKDFALRHGWGSWKLISRKFFKKPGQFR